MSTPAPAMAPALGHFVRVPIEYARYVIDTVAAGRMLGVAPDLVADLASAPLPHVVSPHRGPLYDYVDLMNLALFGGASDTSVPDLALRFLLRFAAGDPRSWFAPRQWLVRVRPPESVATDAAAFAGRLTVRPADLGAPGVEALTDDYLRSTAPTLATGTVAAPGYQVAVRLTGAADAVRDPTANAIFDAALHDLRSGAVVYQAVTEDLRMRQQRAWSLGMADCVVISRVLADRLRAAGLTARARRGYLLGLVGSDHAWCEIHEDGRWKPLDAVFAYLASGGSGIRRIAAADGFVDACRGGRFNRLLPCRGEDASAVILLDGEPAPPWWTSGVSATTWDTGTDAPLARS